VGNLLRRCRSGGNKSRERSKERRTKGERKNRSEGKENGLRIILDNIRRELG
jgi:hypothetical protein